MRIIIKKMLAKLYHCSFCVHSEFIPAPFYLSQKKATEARWPTHIKENNLNNLLLFCNLFFLISRAVFASIGVLNSIAVIDITLRIKEHRLIGECPEAKLNISTYFIQSNLQMKWTTEAIKINKRAIRCKFRKKVNVNDIHEQTAT